MIPQGLCSNKNDHEPHWFESKTLGKFWCHANQTRREPYASEKRREAKALLGVDEQKAR